MEKSIKSPIKASSPRREEMRAKMIDLALNKAEESELTALYYESVAETQKTKESRANFMVQVDGLRDQAKQQRELADFLASN